MKKIITAILAMTMMIVLCSSCGSKQENTKTEASPSPSPSASAAANNTTDDKTADKIGFTIELENGDVMKGELYPNVAPETVSNFVKLAKEGFYTELSPAL